MLGPKVRTEKDDFNQGTWMSLLDLLHTTEFFIPFDQTTLWRRHVAWAKPNGNEIRDYVVQRFSSNMVFLSLLLGTDMSVLMNSNKFSTDIRQALTTEQYYSLKFYIGVILALASCVTVVGLVATYTAWSMISAISDTNCNTMLRSSMGQYVTAMPSRFVVTSLYLFLVWLTLTLIEIVSGPLILAILAVIVSLFFQVVVSLSAFGRLIVHTGAMGKKRILDPDFERQLLPSGLHASLLIKATERSRRRTSVTEQYRYSSTTPSNRLGSSAQSSLASANSQASATSPVNAPLSVAVDDSSLAARKRLDSEETRALENADRVFGGGGMQREESSVDELAKEIFFPRASVLNRTHSYDLKHVVNEALSTRSAGEICDVVHLATAELERRESTAHNVQVEHPDEGDDTPRTIIRRLAAQRSRLVSEDDVKLHAEWEAEDDVRSVYDIEPPVELFSDASLHRFPRASTLNRTRRLNSLRQLVTKGLGGAFAQKGPSNGTRLDQIEETYSAEEMSVPSAALADDDEETCGERQHLLARNGTVNS